MLGSPRKSRISGGHKIRREKLDAASCRRARRRADGSDSRRHALLAVDFTQRGETFEFFADQRTKQLDLRHLIRNRSRQRA